MCYRLSKVRISNVFTKSLKQKFPGHDERDVQPTKRQCEHYATATIVITTANITNATNIPTTISKTTATTRLRMQSKNLKRY